MARPLHKNLTVQVLAAIAVGAVIGWQKPEWGLALEPLASGFLRLVKMVVGPIIFLTVSCGIANLGDLKKVGRIGGKALIYFEIVTTLALAIGLLVGNVFQPGTGIHVEAGAEGDVTKYVEQSKKLSFVDFALHAVPENIVDAFARGDLLQILVFSVLCGIAMAGLGESRRRLLSALEQLIEVMFRIVALIMKVAPLGALGAMAATVGKFGLDALRPLAALMACVYLTMALFIFLVLGTICRLCGVRLWQYLAFIREEILLVLGTSSSETALPRMIEKLELFGCGRSVVGLVIPAGYSFNLDGTSIYLSMAVLFVAQFAGVPLDLGQQLFLLAVLMLTSKGSAAVTGAGFITLAATLSSLPEPKIPLAGLGLLLGVDRFMSEARAITNLIGNGVATIVVSKWEGEFDLARHQAALAGRALEQPGLAGEITADVGHERDAS